MNDVIGALPEELRDVTTKAVQRLQDDVNEIFFEWARRHTIALGVPPQWAISMGCSALALCLANAMHNHALTAGADWPERRTHKFLDELYTILREEQKKHAARIRRDSAGGP